MLITSPASTMPADTVPATTMPASTVPASTVPAVAVPLRTTVFDVASFGPGAAAHERGWPGQGVEGGRGAGTSAAGKAACGYLRDAEHPQLVDAARLSKSGATKVAAGTYLNSTIQISNDQISNDQMTRLIPVTGGEVGSHPAREPGSA